MKLPTRRRVRPCALALAFVVALAQPVILATPIHAASQPIVTDGGAIKSARVYWGRFGPIIITLVWEVVTDWMTGSPPPSSPPVDPPPPQPDPDFAP